MPKSFYFNCKIEWSVLNCSENFSWMNGVVIVSVVGCVVKHCFNNEFEQSCAVDLYGYSTLLAIVLHSMGELI